MLRSFFNRRQARPDLIQPCSTPTKIQNITSVDLYKRLQTDEPLLVLDVRFPEEYAGDGHIVGSRLLPLPHLRQRGNELPKDQLIVCVCRSGNRSQAACEQLADLGFTDLYNLGGGMIGWRRASLPSR